MKLDPSTASIPDPTPFLLLSVALAVFLWPDYAGLIAAAICAAVALVPFVSHWIGRGSEAAILVIVAASAVPRLFLEVGSLKARPEHIVSGLVLCAAPFLWNRRRQPVNWILPDYLLMAYVALNLLSSIFASQAPAQTVKWAVQQVLAILPYFWLRLFVSDFARFRKAFQNLLSIGLICSAFAMVCFYSNVFWGSRLGVEVEQYGDTPATYGLQFEANILGAYSAALAVMLMVMYLFEHKRRYLIGFAFFAMAAMTVSLSRAALGAAFIGLLVVAVFAYKRSQISARVVASIAAACLGAATLVLPFVLNQYIERFKTIEVADPTADPNTLYRAVQTVTALEEVGKHPVFGGGTSSFQLAFEWKSFGTQFDWESTGWIANTELRVLHDTGAVGFIVFSLFVGSLARRSWKLVRMGGNIELVALLASALVYVVTFQATEGTLLAFTWVHLGLIGCAISLGAEPPQMSRPNQDGKLQEF